MVHFECSWVVMIEVPWVVSLVGLFLVPEVWACLYLAVAPFPMFIGEVLSIFGFLGPWLLYYSWFVGHCPFGNKFLIIQKKKKKYGQRLAIPLSTNTTCWPQYSKG